MDCFLTCQLSSLCFLHRRRGASLTPIKRTPLQARQEGQSAKRVRLSHSAKKDADRQNEDCCKNATCGWDASPQRWVITDSNRTGSKDDIEMLALQSGAQNCLI